MVDGVSDEDSLVAWELFLSAYSKGEYLHSCPDIPPLPPRLREMLEHPELAQYGKDNPHTPLFPSTYIDRETARIARDFFCAHGYLPPPRPTTEKSREACVLEYDLLSESQLTNIQEAVDILSGFFPGALISFSLFYKRVQQYYAFAGPQEYIDLFSLCKGGAIPVEDSLCAHAVLSAGKTVFIPDAKKDWRYRYNPYVLRGMEAYIGSPVRLSEDPTRPEAELITIGTLNVCFMNKTVEQVLGREEQAISTRRNKGRTSKNSDRKFSGM
ncbi:hypothetical protein BD324DRAFT_654313 [Kockovaella imperatae]|uniref:Uncharacterized protein n=1 Tax=Kockovaella imperatae TaxID=4999 RepID=A0A1Y1U6V4_9TREE|nr:hypothetical protein BD324DRAFT_654313 [Kockovaella imperatae]ORX33227.1 hypothetical protein BD324DRAFT_654313 [Kockovaella imperatae]